MKKIARRSNNYFLYKIMIFILFLFMMPLGVIAQESDSGYQITSPVSGVIATVHVQKGTVVKKGDLLLEYDKSLVNSNLTEAKAVMELAKINLSEARKELERAKELYDRTVLSEHDLQKAKIQFSQASAQYARAKNQLIHAEWNVTHSKLYAPFNGSITDVYSYAGQYINNEFTAQPLFLIKKLTLKKND